MTPERKKWRNSLSQREKMLRKQILATKKNISDLKSAMNSDVLRDIVDGHFTPKIKEQKIILKALKQELERGGKCESYYVEAKHEFSWWGVPIYECSFCKEQFLNPGEAFKYCPYCGRKIKE